MKYSYDTMYSLIIIVLMTVVPNVYPNADNFRAKIGVDGQFGIGTGRGGIIFSRAVGANSFIDFRKDTVRSEPPTEKEIVMRLFNEVNGDLKTEVILKADARHILQDFRASMQINVEGRTRPMGRRSHTEINIENGLTYKFLSISKKKIPKIQKEDIDKMQSELNGKRRCIFRLASCLGECLGSGIQVDIRMDVDKFIKKIFEAGYKAGVSLSMHGDKRSSVDSHSTKFLNKIKDAVKESPDDIFLVGYALGASVGDDADAAENLSSIIEDVESVESKLMFSLGYRVGVFSTDEGVQRRHRLGWGSPGVRLSSEFPDTFVDLAATGASPGNQEIVGMGFLAAVGFGGGSYTEFLASLQTTMTEDQIILYQSGFESGMAAVDKND